MSKSIYILFTTLLFVSCSSMEVVNDNGIVQGVTIVEVKKLISEGVQVLDVRTVREVSNGRIQGAINIDFYADDFEEQVAAQLNSMKPILVYCKVGGRSSKASNKMAKLNFVKVYNLIGGYDAWKTYKD
jgi:rhodanese-related sulfurtransferase